MLAMPSTMVRKMIGPMTILTSLTKVSPRGLSAFPRSGATTPRSTPSAIAVSTCTVRFEARRFMRGWTGEACMDVAGCDSREYKDGR